MQFFETPENVSEFQRIPRLRRRLGTMTEIVSGVWSSAMVRQFLASPTVPFTI
jgi:hypothetical protein